MITFEEVKSIVSKADPYLLDRSLSDCREDMDKLIKFVARYAAFNSWFGSNVAALSAHIGRSRGIFLDPYEVLPDLNDRSVLVASFFFDAARDEFDDRDTPHRDTHRCLAQATVKGIIDYIHDDKIYHVPVREHVVSLLEQPLWLKALGNSIEKGYGAQGSVHYPSALFRSMGYHVGSEILADQEFTQIDSFLHMEYAGLVEHLKKNEYPIGPQLHNGYSWVSFHSSYGNEGAAKEMEHFNLALDGVKMAIKYTPEHLRSNYKHQVHLGIRDFVEDHVEFFHNVLR